MNKYFEAVKKGGDYWANCMGGRDQDAHVMNQIATNSAFYDFYRMKRCEVSSKEDRRLFQDWEVTRS
jgi:hypothetical protein